ELNASIDTLNIDVDRQKAIARLNYFVVENESSNKFGDQYNHQHSNQTVNK
ncbi:MAG: hypothetical protein JKY01_09125, partial [Pseudomonadales bacterium]|nr:hypothetical protein [Pseudomonadales bacterium]